MKKKIIAIAAIIILLILLVPVPFHYKDGGTVEYRALAYSVSKVHSMSMTSGFYDEGIIIKILGFEVFNNVIYR